MAATGMNLLLFLLMPHLMDTAPAPSSIGALVPQVNVIRVKRPDTMVKRKERKSPEPPPKIKTVKQLTTKPRENKLITRLKLPFEINPRLPSGPTTLELPVMDAGPISVDLGPGNIFSVGQLDAPLTILARIPPLYPLRAKRRGIEGWVKVKFLVDETGNVSEIKIIDARPSGIFEKSVERCVSGWRFKPGTVGGMPVKTTVETTIRFELES